MCFFEKRSLGGNQTKSFAASGSTFDTFPICLGESIFNGLFFKFTMCQNSYFDYDFWFAKKNCQKSKISTLTAEGRHSEFRPSRAREAAGWGCQTRPFEHDTMGFGAKNMLIRLIGHVLFASFIGRGQRPRSKRNRFPPTRTSTVYCDNFRFGQNWLKSGENLKEELHFRFPMALMHFQWGKIQSSQPDFSKLQRIRTVWPRALCSRALSVRKHRVTRQPRPKALARGRI